MELKLSDVSDKGISKYIKDVEKYLEKKFGEKNPTWRLTLRLLADDLLIYDEVKKQVDERGVTYRSNGLVKVNPAVNLMKDYHQRIEALIRELGIGPYSQTKLKTPQSDDGQLELDFLMGGPMRVAQ